MVGWATAPSEAQKAFIAEAYRGLPEHGRLTGRGGTANIEAVLVMRPDLILGIAHLGSRLFTQISGGERQMALVARALGQEPDMLVMDEPTASLDFGNQARVLERIRALCASGLAIVLSTHDPGHAFACAGQVALMKAGRILAVGPPGETVTRAALKNLYGVEVAVAYLEPAGRHVCAPMLSQPGEGEFP